MERERPKEILWEPCSCGSPHCTRQRPTNLGMFYQGTGFEPEEVAWLNQAWAAASALPRLIEAYEEDTGLLSGHDREKLDPSRLIAAREVVAMARAL